MSITSTVDTVPEPAPGRARAPFSLATELWRQASRPRTRIALGFMVALPLIILLAFEFGGGEEDEGAGGGAFSSLVDLATAQLADVANPPVAIGFGAGHGAPEDYEETFVSATDRVTTRDLVLEGAVVIEADLASSVVQLTASLDSPGTSRTVRVLRHDPEKLAAAITEILRRG